MKKVEFVSAFRLGIDSLMNPQKYDGFYGISCSYPFFSGESLDNYCDVYYQHKFINKFVEFGENHFRNFLVFLMDLPLSYNLMAFAEMSERDAKESAQAIGDRLEEKIKKQMFKGKLLRWRDIDHEEGFNRILKEITNYSKEDTRFEYGCISLTINGTKNKLNIVKERFGSKRYKEALSIAKQYSFLDVAVTLFIFENFPVGISKYECPLIIKELYNGLFPNLAERLLLSKMGHIQLSFADKVYTKFYDDEFEGFKGEKDEKS